MSEGVNISLPTTTAFVNVSILDGGGMLGHVSFIHANQTGDQPMSCWVALIQHPSGRNLLWDVGISSVHSPANIDSDLKDINDYTDANRKVYTWGRTRGPELSLREQLKNRQGMEPEDIDTVLFSHAHW